MEINIFKENLSKILSDLKENIGSVNTLVDMEKCKASVVGRNGTLTNLTKDLGTIPKDQKPEAGKTLNEVKNAVNDLLAKKLSEIEEKSLNKDKTLDISLPGRLWQSGKKHPITQTIDDCVAIFRRIGFTVAEGPNIEDVFHCFDALNTPHNHPSRSKNDTFYFKDGRLLRTQTSTVQIRVMETEKPPIRIVAPGPCFRPDTPDATHSANFHQIEGLYIDKNVSMADLKSTLIYFAKEMLGEDVKIRFRPHFFPFTEPSVEYDFSCIMCGGKGCNVCKNSGWIEISGAGMVDPNVLKNVDIDAQEWSGFAFGMGIERITMIRHRINDIRYFYENDIRFLNQF